MHKITPHSRLLARGSLDGRSREGRFLAAARAELAAHVGGAPSTARDAINQHHFGLRPVSRRQRYLSTLAAAASCFMLRMSLEYSRRQATASAV
jgi:hypothetical protein